MHHANQWASLGDLKQAIREAIKGCQTGGHSTDLETVCDFVLSGSKLLMERCRDYLAEQYLRIMVQHELRESKLTGRQLVKRLQKDEATRGQLTFDFYSMPQFRGLRGQITFKGASGKIEYRPYEYSTSEERAMSLKFMDEGIENDIKQRQLRAAADEFVATLVARHGELPPLQLMKIHLSLEDAEASAPGI